MPSFRPVSTSCALSAAAGRDHPHELAIPRALIRSIGQDLDRRLAAHDRSEIDRARVQHDVAQDLGRDPQPRFASRPLAVINVTYRTVDLGPTKFRVSISASITAV